MNTLNIDCYGKIVILSQNYQKILLLTVPLNLEASVILDENPRPWVDWMDFGMDKHLKGDHSDLLIGCR